MQRRSFLSGMVATAAGLLVPDETHQRVRVYSFIKRRPGKARLQIFGGMQPTSPGAPAARDLLLSEMELTAGSASRGLIDVYGQDSSCDRTGVAKWVRYLDGFGAPLLDMPVVRPGEMREGFVMNSATLLAGSTISVQATLSGVPISGVDITLDPKPLSRSPVSLALPEWEDYYAESDDA